MNFSTKIASLLIIAMFSFKGNSQTKLNAYKYVKIPQQLDIKRKQNQFNINQLLESYLNKYNFTAFIQGNPNYNNINPCDVLKLNMNESGFLSTKISISFKDCNDIVVYTTKEGTSKIKEFKPAYYEAIGKTLKDPNIVEHNFTGTTKEIKTYTKPKVENKNATAFTLEFKGKLYNFKETSTKDAFIIFSNNKNIGTLKKQNNTYILNTENLKGTGTFDDFGNFTLKRVNPVNNAVIKDIMARVN